MTAFAESCLLLRSDSPVGQGMQNDAFGCRELSVKHLREHLKKQMNELRIRGGGVRGGGKKTH